MEIEGKKAWWAKIALGVGRESMSKLTMKNVRDGSKRTRPKEKETRKENR